MTTYLTLEIIQLQRQCLRKIDVIEIWERFSQLKHFSKFDIFRSWFFISLKVQAQCQMKRWWNNILIYFVFDILIWVVERRWDSFNERLICYWDKDRSNSDEIWDNVFDFEFELARKIFEVLTNDERLRILQNVIVVVELTIC